MYTPQYRRQHNRIGSVEPRLFLELRKRYKKGGASTPPAVDPSLVAQSQAQANIAGANRQAEINNVRTTSPFGYSGFEEDPSGRWNLSQSLSPQLQDIFNNATGLSRQLSGTAGNVADIAASPALAGGNLVTDAYNTWRGQLPTGPVDTSSLPGLRSSFDFSGLAQLPTSGTDFSNEVRGAQDAAYNTQARYLDPQFSEKESDLRQQLADQGIPVGTDAYSRASGDLARQKNFAYSGARDAATLAGNEEQARLFGENLSSRQEGVGERQSQGAFNNQARQQGLNELITKWAEPLTALGQQAGIGNSILGGVVGNLTGLQPFSDFSFGNSVPTYGSQSTTVQPANVVGAQNSANQAAIARASVAQGQNNQLFNGIGSLGGALGYGNGGLGRTLGIGGSGGGGLFSGLFGGSGGAGAGGFGSLFPGVAAGDLGAYVAANPELALALL